ncbi:MAG: tRNA (N6-threonylcarbamoyladenosine(37)-N6)-methyltransferase TrmO [Desulfotignum sp.]|nr:tRNA (N6-threonylcarbamoyladenosine(37)-N6)-methyltransferase TrmO [Desulfotignum sp.]MCF8088257.1 tRNA (N6-threonylcarbamoyladenosine(37)-N6)-methyltransferase TrmO [Desulfotignum sp.]MCF8138039.1 tRNA (N6-threonylcarbamoyladenosine(37)-N6)-methyltransferase TrmO [Desulfotignum sp.]
MQPMTPIGVIHTPFQNIEDMPIQPKGAAGTSGQIQVDAAFQPGLEDLDGFSHIYLIYSFHKANRTELTVVPFMDTQSRGVYATRSPLRPNHIGISIVRLEKIEGNRLHVLDIDVLNGTPLLDIKPYMEKFDAVTDSCSGWMQASEKEVVEKRSDSRFK